MNHKKCILNFSQVKYMTFLKNKKDPKKSVNEILKAFIANKVGQNYSAKGQKGKKNFTNLYLYKLMESEY